MSAPPGVDGATVVFTACGGLVVDVVLLWLLDRDPGGNNSNGHMLARNRRTGRLGDVSTSWVTFSAIWSASAARSSGAPAAGPSNLAVIDPVCTLCFACIVVATMYHFRIENAEVAVGEK